MAIRSFGGRRARRALRLARRRLPPAHRRRLAVLLSRLEQAGSVRDMDLPGARLHRLAGDRDGSWAVQVSRSLRLVFRFTDGNAYDVELVDYHRS